MAISEPTIKRLWGRAAGRCAFPGCGIDCLVFLRPSVNVVVGEMAHVIAKKPKGPRGKIGGGSDEYENLILLCPTHHRLVDKAPAGQFPEQLLLEWKQRHEERIEESMRAPSFSNRDELNQFVHRLLIENHTCWATYGPEGSIAKSDPNSGAADIWPFRKLSLLVTNNRLISSAVRSQFALFSTNEYRICCKFLEHAEGFERGAIEPIDGIPRFPVEFEELFI